MPYDNMSPAQIFASIDFESIVRLALIYLREIMLYLHAMSYEQFVASLAIFVVVSLFLIHRYSRRYNANHLFHIKNSYRNLKKLRKLRNRQIVLSSLARMHHFQFEEILLSSLGGHGEVKIKRGYRYSGDGGVDGEVRIKGIGRVVIQAKRYNQNNYVSCSDVDAFIRLVSRRWFVRRGYFVTTGRVGRKARDLMAAKGQKHGVSFIDGDNLARLIQGEKIWLPLGGR